MKESIYHIAKALKKARLKNGLTQRELSKKTKIPQNHISKIENAEVDLQLSTFIELCRVLRLEPMLIPVNLVLVINALLDEKQAEKVKQTPMYRLDNEEDKNG